MYVMGVGEALNDERSQDGGSEEEGSSDFSHDVKNRERLPHPRDVHQRYAYTT